MRAFIQRVNEASVNVNNLQIDRIGKGLVVLLGITHKDTEADRDYLCRKIANMRLFDDDDGVMNRSLKDIGGDILIISQFTLLANTRKGNRPSYIEAARPEQSEPMYEEFLKQMTAELGKAVGKGKFGTDMQIALINDGPVSIWIDSKNKG